MQVSFITFDILNDYIDFIVLFHTHIFLQGVTETQTTKMLDLRPWKLRPLWSSYKKI